MTIKDDRGPSKIRKGRFLWRPEQEQQRYLATLRTRIRNGSVYSDQIISEIVDELAPVINESIDNQIAMDY
jgi:hypothetical protein